jgi:hypothetical protein
MTVGRVKPETADLDDLDDIDDVDDSDEEIDML